MHNKTPSSPQTPRSANSADPVDLYHIQKNWSLASSNTYLAIPDGLRPNFGHPPTWPLNLVQALRRLSELTVNQMERAHSLLKTYFRARMRGNLYKGEQKGIHAGLEVIDIQDAIRSLELMNRGQAVEKRSHAVAGPKPRLNAIAVMQGGKRKLSIRDEHRGDAGPSPSKFRRLSHSSGSKGVIGPRQSSPLGKSDGSSSSLSAQSVVGLLAVRRSSSHTSTSSAPLSNAPQRAFTIPKGPASKELVSIPNLQIAKPKPITCTLAAPTPSKASAISPIFALLNFPESPAAIPTAILPTPCLPPVSALPEETDVAQKRKLSSTFDSEADEQKAGDKMSKKEEAELEVRRLELEEAQAALEVSIQKHIVASNKAAIARLEMGGVDVPPRPRSSLGRIG
ncbi:hypothetical protein K458DRAFT_460478 [Lentithecium fluviatile CBS 122367]|uniref:Uncharacterized protein n=1 Tax=Lentithecium fluviatile CBS 122367 TaxID=1168545 RepID=A0A6G1IN86_9PLEO|nr:hypothetical protein K458DRAFT_460478 [Lentithecium fluviatile CBS 122367]